MWTYNRYTVTDTGLGSTDRDLDSRADDPEWMALKILHSNSGIVRDLVLF